MYRRELQDLEQGYPQYVDPNSPTQRVGSDRASQFASITHRFTLYNNKAENHRLSAFCLYDLVAATYNVLLGTIDVWSYALDPH